MKHFLLPVACLLAMAASSLGTAAQAVSGNRTTEPSKNIVQRADVSQFFDGEGTEDSPYLIKTKDDMIKLSQLTCTDNMADLPTYGGSVSSFLGEYFKLTNDIDLEYSTDFKGISTTTNKTVASKLVFQGTFDGNGHQIKRMKIGTVNWSVKPEQNNGIGVLNTTTKTQATCFIGMLGNKGVVKNLTIAADCSIEGTMYMGGIVGEAKVGSTVENCRNYADVLAYDQAAGGIVGYLNGGTVKNCYNEGNITTGAYYSGGIAGLSAGDIQYCANAGDIKITKMTTNNTLWIAGGIAGKQDSRAIVNCLNTGNVHADQQVGGIAGLTTQSINNSLTYGMVTGKAETEVGAVCGKTDFTFGKNLNNTFYDKQILTLPDVQSGSNTGITGMETAELTSGTAISGLDASTWLFTANAYPVLAQFADEPKLSKACRIVATMASGENADAVNSNVKLSEAEGLVWSLNEDAIFAIEGNTLKAPAQKSEKPDVLTATFGNVTKSINIQKNEETQTGPFAGAGTEESPYLISTKADLIKMSKMTCAETSADLSGKTTFKDKYFKLTNDIDLEYDEEFIGISVSSQMSLSQLVIFEGVIDGNGYTIHRMKMGNVDWKIKPENSADGLGTVDVETSRNYFNRSFIGRLSGTVKNLNIASDCDIEGYSGLGGIVAVMASGALVENCRNYADVMGWSTLIGGIAGDVSNNATIRNCYNEGNVTTAILMVGGIAGRLAGTIENCANAGDIKAIGLTTAVNSGNNYDMLQDVGGIAGNAEPQTNTAQIINCVNSGTVEGYQDIGGICGSSAKASGCMNFGTVNGIASDKCGTIFGTNNGKTMSALYCDSQTSIIGAIADSNGIDGTHALTTASLVSGKALSGLDETLWQFDNGSYPVLKQFASEPKLNDARRIVVYFAEGQTAKNVTSAVSVKAVDGFSVKLQNGTKFSIDGNSIMPPATLQAKTAADTILVSTGKLVKPVYIFKQSDLNISGEGTKENPYKIRTANDWNALAQFVAGSNDTFEGVYLTQTSALNFANMEFRPLWTDSNVPFQGTYDGGKRIIANVMHSASTPYTGLFGYIGDKGTVSDITVTGSMSSTASGIGAIAGFTRGLIVSCVNEAEISSSAAEVGGIAGRAGEGARFIGCANQADVAGHDCIGGIVGYIEGENTSVENCYNVAAVKASANKAGGISGYGVASGIKFQNCWNAGNVSTSLEVQGTNDNAGYAIGGISGFSSAMYTDCYNLGNVKGASEVGGLVGHPVKDSTGFDHCYNAGTMTADNDACGSIVGVDTDKQDAWSSLNQVKDTYYVTDFGKYGNDKVGSATTMSELAAMTFGDNWTSIDSYSLPIPTVFASTDAALLHSTAAILAEGDTYDCVTKDFNVSNMNRLTWSADISQITISNGLATVEKGYVGPAVLTAKLGNYKKTIKLFINNPSAIDTVNADHNGNVVVKETFYTTSGLQVTKPETADGRIYIVVRVYADGSTKTLKFINNID